MLADGTCVIDIFIPVDAPGGTDVVKWDLIRRAARMILMTCVVRPFNDGGYVSHIGTYSTAHIESDIQASFRTIYRHIKRLNENIDLNEVARKNIEVS